MGRLITRAHRRGRIKGRNANEVGCCDAVVGKLMRLARGPGVFASSQGASSPNSPHTHAIMPAPRQVFIAVIGKPNVPFLDWR